MAVTDFIIYRTKWYKHPPIQIPFKIRNRKSPVYQIRKNHFDSEYEVVKHEITKGRIDSTLVFLFPINLLVGIKKYRENDSVFNIPSHYLASFYATELSLSDYWENTYTKAKESIDAEIKLKEAKVLEEKLMLEKLNKEFEENVN